MVVLDGMQGGTAATQEVFIEHVGLPTLACIRPAVQALQDMDMHRKVQLIVSGGIRNGADVAKALALGADAVSIGTAALVALGDNDPALEKEYNKLGTTAGAYDDWHEGLDPAGISTQDPELSKRLDPVAAGRRLANYLKVMTLGSSNHRPRLWEIARTQSGAGRFGRFKCGSCGDGADSSGGHQLDTGSGRLIS